MSETTLSQPAAKAPVTRSAGPARAAERLALLAFALFAALALYVSAGPFRTADGWFHLGAGAAYVEEGPWPERDPMLFTALEEAPIQHEWLFGAAAHVVRTTLGFHGLRAAHALLVLAALALAFAAFRRVSGSTAAAAGASALLLLLAWYRYWQFRPDLVSIPATWLLFLLLFAEREEPPPWRRVVAAALLAMLWANLHSLFGVGILLTGAGAAGFLARSFGLRIAKAPEFARAARRSAARVAAAAGLMTLASLANPRGVEQLLTFLTSTRESRLWSIRDEWQPFVPWEPERYGDELGLPVLVAASALLVVFALASVAWLVAFLRRPGVERLRAGDPVLLFLGIAGAVAMCASIRFLWLGAFPLLFLLRLGRGRALLSAAPQAALALACLIAFVTSRAFTSTRPPLDGWLAEGYSVDAYPMTPGVRFLRELEAEGELYCDYTSGGYVGYWLAPRLRTFIDGRVEHYPVDVFDDYIAIRNQRLAPAPSFLERLDARGVDLFLGHIPPLGPGGAPEVPNPCLAGLPGWLTVFRSYDSGVYLRLGEANRANLERLAALAAREGLRFDPERGLDLDALVRERPEWAVANRALPTDHAELVAALELPDAGARYRALHRLGLAYALIGAHEEALSMHRRALAIVPTERWPRRRAICALFELGRIDEAARELAELEAQDPQDAWLGLFRAAVDEVRATLPGPDWTTPLGRRLVLNRLPLFDANEYLAAVAGRYLELRPR